MSRRFAVALAACSLLAAACSPKKSSSDCTGGAIACGDVCVDPSSDNRNCGTCGNACEAGSACTNGVCAVSCAVGQVNCGGTCINPNTDRSHCGATGTCTGQDAGAVCAADQICSLGTCAQSCLTGWNACPTSDPTYCADLQHDPNDCGACGTTCAAGYSCSGGTCRSSCPAGEYACGGRCIDPASDPVYCGAAANCSGATACRANEACTNGTCTPMARLATPIVTGDPGVTSWAQTVPDEDGAGSVFPGQANIWWLDRDFSLAGAPWGYEYSSALQLAVGDVTPSPSIATLQGDWTGQLHLFPYDQRADEVTFLTPRFGIADGVVTAAIGAFSALPSPLDGYFSGYLNGTADSRLFRTVTLEANQTYTLIWQDEFDLHPLYPASPVGAAAPPYGPRYQVVLRNTNTGAVIGDPLYVTTATTWTSASWRTASFSTPGNVPPGDVDLSFELRSAAFGYAIVDDVALFSDAAFVVTTDNNGDFESGVAPWRYGGDGESRNVLSGERAVDVDPAGATTLAVTRTFYAPPTAAWGRFVDEFRNDGDAPVTTKVVYRAALGYPYWSDPVVALAAAGRAVVGHDALGNVRDAGIVFGAGSPFYGDPSSPGEVFIIHDLTVPAHSAVALAHFVVQLGQGAVLADHLTTATDAVCAAIADGFPGEYAQDLEPGVLARIANFATF